MNKSILLQTLIDIIIKEIGIHLFNNKYTMVGESGIKIPLVQAVNEILSLSDLLSKFPLLLNLGEGLIKKDVDIVEKIIEDIKNNYLK